MSRFRVPLDCTGMSVEHQQFEVQRATVVVAGKPEEIASVKVPDALDAHLTKLGYQRVSMPQQDAAPPVNEKGERLDGPTFAEYVAAGYAPESYPPKGFASKEDPKELKKMIAAAKAQKEADDKAKAADADAKAKAAEAKG